jgi:glycosyltransferase involved in cell wall biosynthesis
MINTSVPVSVVIPCYRCFDSIERAVDSVMLQTRIPAEVILVDDFSNDSLRTVSQLNVLKNKYANRCTFIIVELTENVGAGNARNVGWSKSSQPFIAFLDADDAWDVNKLEIQTKWMLEHKCYAFSSHQSVLKRGDFNFSQKSLAIDYLGINKFSMLFKNAIATRTVMVRSNIEQRFSINLRYAEDYYLWMSILFFGGLAAKINLPLAYTFKSNYSEYGLSTNLIGMHRGVKFVLRYLNLENKISYPLYFLACSYEMFKYRCRVMNVYVKKRLALRAYHG